MLKFDVTTPFEKYSQITGRFGFMEEDRYAVCMVTYPTGSTGVEIKLLLHNFTHFDVIFHLATPIDFLQNVLVVGKIQEEEVSLSNRYLRCVLYRGSILYTKEDDDKRFFFSYIALEVEFTGRR